MSGVAVLQVFKPDLLTSLNGAVTSGHSSFVLTTVLGLGVNDLLTFDTGGNLEVLKIATINTGTKTVTTTTNSAFNHADKSQVLRVGGVTNAANTPNLLSDLSASTSGMRLASWSDLQQGGCGPAAFQLYSTYENTQNTVFGNQVLWSCLGGTVSSNATAGSATVTVTNLLNQMYQPTYTQIPSAWSTTLNPADVGSPMTLSGGNLVATIGATGGFRSGRAFASMSSGRWYWEVTVTNIGSGGANECIIGIGTSAANLNSYVGSDAFGWGYDSSGQKQHGGSGPAYGASYTTGAVLGFALDLVAGTLTFYKNGVSQGVAFTGLSGTFFPMVSGGQNAVMTCNFAGPFVYTPPAGYLAKVVDIIAGDPIVISDGTNTELFTASTVTDNGNSTWTIALGAAGAGLTQTTLTNAYSAGATVTRLQWQGYIESRNRVTRADNIFTLNCAGFFNRYGFLLGNSTIDGSDAAAAILAIAQSYSSVLTSVYVNSSNFISSPTNNVTVKNAKDTQIASLFSTILQQESSTSTAYFYAIWVDAMKAIHHWPVPTVGTSTGTWNIFGSSPTKILTTGTTNPSNIYGDYIADVDTTDMDGTSIANALIVLGGQNPTDSSQVRILVEQSDSISQFGWLESTLSNSDITSPDALAAWAGMRLALMAFPAEGTKVTLDVASGRINGRDLLQINGFTDSSTRTLNVIEADYQYDPATMNISGSLSLGMFSPTAQTVTNEIASEKAQVGGSNVPKVNLGGTYVVSGLTYSTSGNTITFQPGTIMYQGVQYPISGGSLTASDGDTTYRASSSGLNVVEAGSRTWNGRKVYATKAYTIASKLATPSAVVNDDGLLLCRVQCVAGNIIGVIPLGSSGGIGGNNLKPPTPATLSIASYSPTITAEGAASAKFSFTATLTNLPIDDTIASVDLSYRTAGGGSSDWHTWVPCIFKPSSTAISGTIHGIPAGSTAGYDVAVQARGQNGAPLGSPVLLAASPTITAASVAAAIASWNDFGGTINADGSWSNVDGKSSTTLYPLATGTVFTAQANIAKGGTAASGIMLGNATNGYRVYYDSAGHVGIDKYVGGVNTNIGTLVSETNDTNYHTLKLTVAVLGASNNLIQATWDGVDPNNAANPGGIVDTSLNLTSGTWPVTLYTGGSTGKVTGYAANTALDHYVKLAPIVKKRIGGDGTLAVDSTTGPISGTLPLVNHASPVQAQLNASAGSDGSFLAGGSVSNRHVQAQSVAGTQTLPTRYSTQQTNASYGGVAWATASTGGSAIAPTTTLTNGQTIYYNTGSGSYGGSGIPVQTSYNVPASGSITCLFTHNAFISGGNGLPRVYFSGSSAGGGTTTLQTSGVSGTSAGSASGVSYGSPVPRPNYSQANGAPVTFSATTSVAVSGTNPISLNLTSVTCPSDTDGGVTLTVTLKNPAGTVVQTWTGIASSASFPLSYSTAGASGTWVWTVQAIAYNNNVFADIPYSTSYTASFSGTVSYWQTTGASGNTYVLASDGTTQRINTLDGNVQFTQIAPDTIAFKVFNSATSALSFSIGVDVGGV